MTVVILQDPAEVQHYPGIYRPPPRSNNRVLCFVNLCCVEPDATSHLFLLRLCLIIKRNIAPLMFSAYHRPLGRPHHRYSLKINYIGNITHILMGMSATREKQDGHIKVSEELSRMPSPQMQKLRIISSRIRQARRNAHSVAKRIITCRIS